MTTAGQQDDLKSLAYRTTRHNIGVLLASRPDVAGRVVPATPDWTVRDLLAHLVGIARSVLGRLSGTPLADAFPGATADLAELLAEWNRVGPLVEPLLATPTGHDLRPMLMDAYTHELDIRLALGAAWPTDHPAFDGALDLLVAGFSRAVRERGLPSVRIELDGRRWQAGDGTPTTTVSGHRLDVYRSFAGRRTPKQIAGLAWSADPRPWLPAFEWGPFHPPTRPVETLVSR
ncbi:MAG TPA: maleylpyruvate isomerase family mycothiol-dependent enzyme [Kutzneria sp.]